MAIIGLIVVLLIAVCLFNSRVETPTIEIGNIQSIPESEVKVLNLVDDEDLVLDCGCICKMKSDGGDTSVHTSTIFCATCQKKLDDENRKTAEMNG